jgi:hypothetical protein
MSDEFPEGYPKIITLQPLRHDGYEYPPGAEVVNMEVTTAQQMEDNIIRVVDSPEEEEQLLETE